MIETFYGNGRIMPIHKAREGSRMQTVDVFRWQSLRKRKFSQKRKPRFLKLKISKKEKLGLDKPSYEWL